MGGLANSRLTTVLAAACTAVILALNLLLVYITFGGTLPIAD
jgi:manganese transport protein